MYMRRVTAIEVTAAWVQGTMQTLNLFLNEALADVVVARVQDVLLQTSTQLQNCIAAWSISATLDLVFIQTHVGDSLFDWEFSI